MSLIGTLGGTEIAPSLLRVGAVGLASYSALTWINKHYGVEILNAAPHRILAAGIIAVAAEFSLRTLSSEKGMHAARLRSSLRALQKDLQDPKNRAKVAELFSRELGFNVTEEGLEALAEGRFGSVQAESMSELRDQLALIKDDQEAIKELIESLVSNGHATRIDSSTVEAKTTSSKRKPAAKTAKAKADAKSEVQELREQVNSMKSDIAEILKAVKAAK